MPSFAAGMPNWLLSGSDANICQHGDLHAAAEAEAADAGDRRLRVTLRAARAAPRSVSNIPRGRRIVAGFFELADIGARDEALSPAPTRITTRTSGLSRSSTSAWPRPSHISSDIALRLPGLLKVMIPTPSPTLCRILPSAWDVSAFFGVSSIEVSSPFQESTKGPKFAWA